MPCDDGLTNATSAMEIAGGSFNAETGTATVTAQLLEDARQMREERRPTPASRGRGVHDITEQFTNASKRLQPGELVKDEHFTLFEAVGALEIMDDKMDSGYVPAGDTFESDFDPCQHLSPDQIIWIMDELLRLEMLFHAGYPLSQNVFTSLHIFRLIDPDNRPPYSFDFHDHTPAENSLVNIVLRAYCLALLKCCDLALKCIQSQIYFEEEDFVTSLFGRELCSHLTPQDALGLLMDAMAWMSSADLDETTKHAINNRLSLRETLLYCFDEPLPLSENHWTMLRSQFAALVEHKKPSERVAMAFSDKVQRQLATSTPPRPMPHLTLDEALHQWLQLCEDAVVARDLCTRDFIRSPMKLAQAAWEFGYRQPDPMTLIRAKMQEGLTWEEGGDYDGGATELLLADIREKVLPGDWIAERDSFAVEVPTDIRHRTSRVVLDFMSQALSDYINLFRMVCQNRSRMRRMLTQAVMLWDDLEHKAGAFDEQLNRIVHTAPRSFRCGDVSVGPLSMWTKLSKLQICEWTVQVGFETDIFLPDELGVMYQILAWFADLRSSHLMALQYPVGIWPGAEDYQSVFRARVKSSQTWRDCEFLLVSASRAIAEALGLLYRHLEACGLIQGRHHKAYYNMQEQFEARMKPFLGLNRDRIPQAAMLYGTAAANGDDDFERAKSVSTSLLGEAKRYLESLKTAGTDEVRRQIKPLFVACIAVSSAFARLQQIRRDGHIENDCRTTSLQDFAEVMINLGGEKRHHDWWVLPEVKAKK